ncbi:hypothetical protein FKM82_028598 [Ascaphus truei]
MYYLENQKSGHFLKDVVAYSLAIVPIWRSHNDQRMRVSGRLRSVMLTWYRCISLNKRFSVFTRLLLKMNK